MSTKEEVSPIRKTDKCIYKKDFPDSKELVTEEDGEEAIEEMSNSLNHLNVGEEEINIDSALKTNLEEVGVGEKLLEVDIVEKEVFVAVDASEVDPLETGEDDEVFEKCVRRKRLEKLKGEIERVKQNLKDGEEKEPRKAKNSVEGALSTIGDTSPGNQVSRNWFRPSAHKFPAFQSPPKVVEIKEPLETEVENSLQSVESKKPFPLWPQAVDGAADAARKARKEKLHQFRVMRALRRCNLPTKTAHEHEEEVLPDEGKSANVEVASVDVEKAIKTDRCCRRDCKKKIGLTGFACRCRLVFCSLHRYSDKHECTFDYKALGKSEIAAANPIIAPKKIVKI